MSICWKWPETGKFWQVLDIQSCPARKSLNVLVFKSSPADFFQKFFCGLLAKIFYGSSLQRFSSGLLCKDFLRAFFAKVFCRLLCKALLQVSFTKSFGWSSVECPFAVFYKEFSVMLHFPWQAPLTYLTVPWGFPARKNSQILPLKVGFQLKTGNMRKIRHFNLYKFFASL